MKAVDTYYGISSTERFNMTLMEVYPLYDLDLCEVCGSYQVSYYSWPFLCMNSVLYEFEKHHIKRSK